MHPSPFKHARSLHACAAVALLVGGVLSLQGCVFSSDRSDRREARAESSLIPSDTLPSNVSRDSAIAVLSSMQRTAFDSAFAALEAYGVTRYVRTEQLSPSGVITALRSSVLRYPDSSRDGTILRRDSSGAFRRGGLFGRVAPDQQPTARPANFAAQVLSDQPAYVEPRTREAFRYALQADTLRDGTPVYVLEAIARDYGTGREQGIRYARLHIVRSTRELIGLTTVRDDEVLLFGENSRLSFHLRRAPDGRRDWVPHVTRVRALVHVPFRTPRQFRTVSAFYAYDSSPAD